MRNCLYIPLLLFTLHVRAQIHEVLITDTAVSYREIVDGDTLYDLRSFLIPPLDGPGPLPYKPTYNGHWIIYYDREKKHKATEVTIAEGKMAGSFAAWYRDGQQFAVYSGEGPFVGNYTWYRNGNLFRANYTNGDTCFEVIYNKNGNVRYRVTYYDGLKGVVYGRRLKETWHENGTREYSGYTRCDSTTGWRDREVGWQRFYDKEGKLKMEFLYGEQGEFIERHDY